MSDVTPAEKAAEALEWALAEIDGRTKYTSDEQFENARSCALEALAALRSPPANPTVGVEAAWPAGCTDPDSCFRHRACMYAGCQHAGDVIDPSRAAEATDGDA